MIYLPQDLPAPAAVDSPATRAETDRIPADDRVRLARVTRLDQQDDLADGDPLWQELR